MKNVKNVFYIYGTINYMPTVHYTYGIGPYLFYIRLTNNLGLDINLSDTLIRLK